MINKDEILIEVEKIFKDIFDDDMLTITEETNAQDIEDWDSLEQINLLVAMEKKFSIKFDITEVANLKNIGDMISLIERKLI